MINTDKFEQALYEDSKKAFTEIVSECGDDLYVIGLYFFGGYDGVMPLFNTKSALKGVQEGLEGEDRYLIDYIAKWNPTDYPSLEEYSEYYDNSVSEMQALSDNYADQSDEEADAEWKHVFNVMEGVLNRLDDEGVFTRFSKREDITLVITTYDEGEDEKFDRIKRLNPQPALNKISTEFETMIATRAKWEQEAWDNAMNKLNKE